MTVERNTITEVCAPGEHRRCSAATRESRLQSGILFTLNIRTHNVRGV